MARKVVDGPVITVEVNGDLLTYEDKELTGKKSLIARVYKSCIEESKVPLTIYGPYVTANIDDPSDHLGIAAALISVSPQAKVVEAPSSVWDILQVDVS